MNIHMYNKKEYKFKLPFKNNLKHALQTNVILNLKSLSVFLFISFAHLNLVFNELISRFIAS